MIRVSYLFFFLLSFGEFFFTSLDIRRISKGLSYWVMNFHEPCLLPCSFDYPFCANKLQTDQIPQYVPIIPAAWLDDTIERHGNLDQTQSAKIHSASNQLNCLKETQTTCWLGRNSVNRANNCPVTLLDAFGSPGLRGAFLTAPRYSVADKREGGDEMSMQC